MAVELGSPETLTLCATAFMVGTVHTLLGPDHYLPFAAMARAGDWSTPRTLAVTAACGLGHVAGSVAIGLVGLAAGIAVMRLESLEAFRGDTAAWLLIGFGLAYSVWGLVRAYRTQSGGRGHAHLHVHADGTVHTHEHNHHGGHVHVHEPPAAVRAVWAPWIMFLLFAFGPCEPLIPLLMYPAAKASGLAVFGVVAAFTLATVGTMLVAVLVLRSGASFVRLPRLDRFAHAFAGLAILACGLLVKAGL
jgi:nickel/cobalt transporter (NicO) family protein